MSGAFRRFAVWADRHPDALWLRLCAVSIIGAFALVACSSAADSAIAEGIPTAPVSQVQILPMAAGWGNVLTACHGTTRIYLSDPSVGYSGPPIAVVPADPTCTAVPQ